MIRNFLAPLAVALAVCAAASAAPVSVGDVTFSPKFNKTLVEKYGQREGEALASDVRKSLSRELAGIDAPHAVRVDVVIVDAQPNRPTFKEMGDRPGLSLQSIAVGGAKLQATLRDPGGAALRTVEYSWYETDIRWEGAASTWTDASRAIRWFASQVKEAAQDTRPVPAGS